MKETMPNYEENERKVYNLLIISNKNDEIINIHWILKNTTILMFTNNHLLNIREESIPLSIFC